MAMPRRMDVDDYFGRLTAVQRPHLDALRELSRAAAPTAREELKWNQPAYVLDTTLWLLQAFAKHAALRLPLRIVGAHAAEIETAGYEAGAGMIKLLYDRELPIELLETLLRARVDEYEATGAPWSER